MHNVLKRLFRFRFRDSAKQCPLTCAASLSVACLLVAPLAPAQRTLPSPGRPVFPSEQLASEAFGNDSPWYLLNIPFLEIDDASIQATYYYRWQVYHSHMRDLGRAGSDVTEFLPPVSWSRHPYEDLNDSSSFHILEGRWLRDPSIVGRLVDHLYSGAGNDRHFSESIASAAFAWTQVTGDPCPALRHLDAMQAIYNLWDDHFDANRNLYWIEPILDATEYTISSIDASGAGFTENTNPRNDGFNGGFAFRPSINSFQYGNARAIAALAHFAGKDEIAADYTRRSENLRAAVLGQLWNAKLTHFTDVYQRSTPTVSAGDFIRGRELVGLVPWQFEVPPQETAAGGQVYAASWKHLQSADELAGTYGLRTVEPSYPRYMRQYRYVNGASPEPPECQWNGPSWPFQTSQVLSGMANLLDDYPPEAARQAGVSADLYVHLLRQYTEQHRRGRVLDIEEDYNPDNGKVIVGLDRSHHYLHSTYNDLILSGLLGIRPSMADSFEIMPQLPTGPAEKPIRYFALQGLIYHGREVEIVYDADGSRYHIGSGLSVFIDGVAVVHSVPLGRVHVDLPKRRGAQAAQSDGLTGAASINLAVNVWGRPASAYEPDLPLASASSVVPQPDSTLMKTSSLYEPIDGRQWFFPEVPHGWSPVRTAAQGSAASLPEDDWYAVDLRRATLLNGVELAFLADGEHFAAPSAVRLQTRTNGVWVDVALTSTASVVPNGVTSLRFHPLSAQELRITMPVTSGLLPPRLIAFKTFGPATPASAGDRFVAGGGN